MEFEEIDPNASEFEEVDPNASEFEEVDPDAEFEEVDPNAEFEEVDPDANPEDYSTIGDIARGSGAGAVNVIQGIAELGAMGIDAVADTNTLKSTSDAFTTVKESLGLVPTGTAGHIAEMIVNYGSLAIPVGGWIGAAGKAGQAVKAGAVATDVITGATKVRRAAQTFGATKTGQALTATRTARAGTTALATGIADILVSPSTNRTLADSWDALPESMRTEDLEGLVGRDRAAAGLANKFKLGLEGAGFTLAGEAILPVVGMAVSSISKVPGVPALAGALSSGLDALGTFMTKNSYVKKYLTPNGLAPAEVANIIRTAEGITEFDMQLASGVFAKYDKTMKKATSAMGLFNRGRVSTQRAYEDTMDYLAKTPDPQTGATRVDANVFRSRYGEKALNATEAMRKTIDDLSVRFEDSINAAPNLSPTQKAQLLQQFSNGQGQYIRRLYDLHLKPEKFEGIAAAARPQYQTALRQVATYLGRVNPTLSDPMGAAKLAIDDVFGQGQNSLTGLGLSLEQQNLRRAETTALGAEKTVGRTTIFKLASGMLIDRVSMLDNAPMLREMMGEVRNPREAFLRTVDAMSSTMASQKVYDNILGGGLEPMQSAITKMNQGDKKKFIIDGSTVSDDAAAAMDAMGYVKAGEADINNPFGGTFGSLSGNWIPKEIYNSLTIAARSHSPMQEALAVALQAKGFTQMAKTVLNPLSQVRNFLSNTFILGANGLVGRNMGIFEASDVLMSNAINSPQQFKLLKAMAEEGAIGQNIQLNEMNRLLKEHGESGVSAMLKKGGDAFRQSKLGAPVRFMEKTYQLGDDYWKMVAALGEKSRYGAAFRAARLDIENVAPEVQEFLIKSGLAGRTSSIAGTSFGDIFAIDITKSTMPTYSMVPEAIKNLRKIPVIGNFMSFPAEIIRTTGNIVSRSLKELSFKAFENGQSLIRGVSPEDAKILQRQVRAIGAQRLSSYVAMATVAPGATIAAAHSVLGVTPEQEDMIRQSSATFSKGNSLMAIEPVGEDGKTQIVDLSYMMPYEFMLAPARAAYQTWLEKGEMDADIGNQIVTSAWEGFKKFAEPFASESLGAERIIDVTIRNGKTATGAPIYEQGADLGDKLAAALTHVSAAFIPGIAEQFVTVKGGEFVQGRATRAATGNFSLSGDAYTPAEEAGTLLTGLRPMNIDFSRSLGYAGGEYSSMRSSATKIFTGKADDNDITEQGVLDAYIKSNDARKTHMAGLYAKVERARKAGMSDFEIRKSFSGGAVTKKELNFIMRNEYLPYRPSRALIREINNEVNILKENRLLKALPMEKINELFRQYNKNTLVSSDEEAGQTSEFEEVDPTAAEFEEVDPTAAEFEEVDSAAAPAPQPQAPAPQTAAPAPQAQAQQQQQNPAPTVSPTLLGGNPYEAMKNFELSQYLSTKLWGQ